MRSAAVWMLLGFAEAVVAATVPAGSTVERGFEHLPVKREHEHVASARKRDLRLQRHRRQVEAYTTNTMDPAKMADHAAILAAAQELEGASMRRRADATNGGSAPMDDYYSAGVDIGYSANVSIGTPAQIFTMVPDTGSSDLWVPSTQSTDPGHHLFNTGSSSTYQSTSQAFTDSYGLGQASGIVSRDTVQFAGFTVTNKTFGVANKVDSQFQQQFNDGIIGMASSVLSNMSAYTFFEDLISGKQINNPYFSVFLARGRQYASGSSSSDALIGGSTICLGCMAATANVQSSGSMFYVPVTLFAFYEVQVTGISLNGQAIGSTSHLAIIDTGTTDMILPTKVAAAMMAPVKGQLQRDGSYIVPVANIDTTTKFTVNFNGGSIDINPLDLIAGYADSSRRYYYMNVYASDTQDPNGALISIMGDVFIKNALTVFSYSQNGSPAVGFQQLIANSMGDTSSVAIAAQTAPGVLTSGTFRATGTRTGISVSGTAASSASASRAAARGRFDVSGVTMGSAAAALVGIVAGVAMTI